MSPVLVALHRDVTSRIDSSACSARGVLVLERSCGREWEIDLFGRAVAATVRFNEGAF